MNEIILCKYGEIVLKGLNKKQFETVMLKQIKHRIEPFGRFSVTSAQSIAYIKPEACDGDFEEETDIEGAFDAVRKVFGIVTVAKAAVTEKNMNAIFSAVLDYILPEINRREYRTFKVEGKRGDKTFSLTSPEISAEVGALILKNASRLRVDVKNPDVVVRVEIRAQNAYVYIDSVKGAGGLPVGSGGRGLLLLSGGIDSPVAGWMMAKRGVAIDALHFESFPYTSERAREKVFELARIMSEWCGPIHMHVISLTKIQEELRKSCAEEYFTLLLRRFMMRLSCRAAGRFKCGALITGESLGQVASQTMDAFAVTNSVCDRVVFRPCIGLDKEEIVEVARKIGTFETSILPYEDCCTVFTPKHPKTKPELYKVIEQENKLDFKGLEQEAFSGMSTILIK